MRNAPPMSLLEPESRLHQVLVLSPDRALADALEEALAAWGFDAVHAATAEAALRSCGRLHPSTVLVDLLSGEAFASVSAALRETLGDDTPPLVILSRDQLPARSGADVIQLQVPFGLDDLREALESACHDGRRLVH